MARQLCTVDGCEKFCVGLGYCEMHYRRFRRQGMVGLDRPPRPHRPHRRHGCLIDGCDRPHSGLGYCEMHYFRLRRQGTTEFVGKQLIEEPVYRTLHQRVQKSRGHASQHLCVDCGVQAQHWSYDYSDPDERTDPETGCPYSLDLGAYQARCVPCHRRFDAERSNLVHPSHQECW